MSDENFDSPDYWTKSWASHIENYLSAPARCGIWLNSKFQLKDLSILECAGGSCRDARYLHGLGFRAVGSDFDEKTLRYLKKRFPEEHFEMRKENAFSMSYRSNSIDIVYHNGFWIYFESDEQIKDLIKEQARVANRYLIALVHNRGNEDLVDVFSQKANFDSLYKIRFFRKQELLELVAGAGIKYKKVSFYKFGGPVDKLYAVSKRISILSPVVHWLVPKIYKLQPWVLTERIALVVEL